MIAIKPAAKDDHYAASQKPVIVNNESGNYNTEEKLMFTRKLGHSEIKVSTVGLGCWAIGGLFYDEMGLPIGWGQIDDQESIRAIHTALDLGINFFDTA